MGFQKEVVLAMATWVHPRDVIHSAMAMRSSVMASNVRTSFPFGVIAQATTVFLCTSSIPQHRACTMSIHSHPCDWIEAGATTTPIILSRVLPSWREQHTVVHLVDEVSLLLGLKAPRNFDLPRQPQLFIRYDPIFILPMVARPRHGGLLGNDVVDYEVDKN